MITNCNVEQVIAQCQKMYHAANDPHMTGFVNWPCKQDLYRVKFAVEEMLRNTSNFAGETEWLEEQKKQQMWKELQK